MFLETSALTGENVQESLFAHASYLLPNACMKCTSFNDIAGSTFLVSHHHAGSRASKIAIVVRRRTACVYFGVQGLGFGYIDCGQDVFHTLAQRILNKASASSA